MTCPDCGLELEEGAPHTPLACTTEQLRLARLRVARLEQDVRDWKEAWWHHREVIGGLWWHHPALGEGHP